MPKLRPETAQARASKIIKDYSDAGFNQTRLAKINGTSQPAVSQCLKRLPIKKTLQEIINRNLTKAGITQRKVYKRLDEQLDATRIISAVVSPDGKDRDASGQTCDFIDIPDNTARDKAIDKCLTLFGHIKQANSNGKGTTILILDYGYRNKTVDSAIRT